MRVRTGINVKYSHDDEALIAEVLRWREFAYADEAMLAYWLNLLRPYSYNAPYYTGDGDDYGFVPERQFMPWHRIPLEREGVKIILIDLWNLKDTALKLVEDHGFSCLICGVRTSMKMRGRTGSYGDAIRHAVWERQEVMGPELVCRECATDVPAIMSPWITRRRMKAAVDRLVRRAQPLRAAA